MIKDSFPICPIQDQFKEGILSIQDHFEEGIYTCSECGHELFASFQKYEHQTPWPAFTETLHKDSVAKYQESPNALKVGIGKVFKLESLFGVHIS